MRTAAAILAALFAAGVRVIDAVPAVVSASQIIERCGTLGPITIGNDINALMKTGRLKLRRAGQAWETDDRSIRMSVDQSSRIVDILTNRKGAFTQRYVVLGDSRLEDVVQRYGPPQSAATQRLMSGENGFGVLYAYEGIMFSVKDTRRPLPSSSEPADTTIRTLSRQPVEQVWLQQKRRDPSGRVLPCDRKS